MSTCGVDNKHRDTFLAPTCIRSPVPAAGKGPSGGPKTDATGERYVAYSRSEASKLALLGYTPKAFARGINTHNRFGGSDLASCVAPRRRAEGADLRGSTNLAAAQRVCILLAKYLFAKNLPALRHEPPQSSRTSSSP